ncbi:DUF3823 domain-containing protein [Mucilaginibacter limnophilus]|uniref:DUF3823 domain-containing protein n=1 Tax=Mucilaginibacter limnophilus TaxID=1932778 RepID=A0A3S2WX98_9SPHI|nr:DUF3823 domain-containing protein [Mucilaginibacter limnophilus]RVU00141.1 DUF3823 domain-containing protein [Mucilaginibacter limnophilus]
MKKQISRLLLLGISVLAVSACTKTDNYEGPNASFEGRIIDATTGENLQSETGSTQIRLEQQDWETTASPQTIPSKYDGTFKDTKLFKGKYKVVPTNGGFWPVYDTATVDIGSNTQHNFEVTPYAKITNFSSELVDGNTLRLTFTIDPPVTAGLPTLRTIQPLVNITSMVGTGATIRDYSVTERLNMNGKAFAELPDVSTDVDVAGKTMTLEVPNLKRGTKFYVRVGVQWNDSFASWNLSNILEVQVPNE